MFHLRSKIPILILGMTLLLGSIPMAKASHSSIVSFMYGVIGGSLEFPEEALPNDTVSYNLTIVAYFDVTIINFTVKISGLVGEKWQKLNTEQIISHSLVQDENLTRQVIVTLPQNTSERLHCVIEASTDWGFGKTTFYATYVRPITYNELSDLYDELLVNYSTIYADYNKLLPDYDVLNSTYVSIVAEHDIMQTNYDSLNSSYEILMVNHDSLQEQYSYIKTKYDASIAELNIVRNLMYIFTVTTVIFVATTAYFGKKAPYIVLRKETAVKPNKE